ncbi:three-prime repair exonuclease 1-like [Plodia interpunctella]|uniref:three-prime repair exonuclease 1-like n=1 Tax=Plodia interpunctella TaxID=58824 RepID=UPI0023679AFC|nr:three-prime repair exonuclease 1-like [Plodia interpunctella]
MSNNMTHKVFTYVFLDLETTGLPSEECNKTKITELSMVAVCRDHLLETRPGWAPRVQDKLTLCFNPQKMVNPESSGATGLDNDLLEQKSSFNKDICYIIRTFLNVQQKPVCLIAQNGMGFDFPILKHHFERNEESLPADIMCADCYHGFYDILEKKEEEYNIFFSQQAGDVTPDNTSKTPPRGEKSRKDLMKVFCDLPSGNAGETCNEKKDIKYVNEFIQIERNVAVPANTSTPKISSQNNLNTSADNPDRIEASSVTASTEVGSDSLNELDLQVSMNMKSLNETTPKRRTKYLPQKRSIGEIRNRRYPWSNNTRPKKSYKLGHIYERVLNRPAVEAHRAENDCIYALEISAALAEEFVTWVDVNCCPFTEIKPMTIGVKIGF